MEVSMKPKLEKLDSLRALACLDVFAFHAYLVYWGAYSVTFFLMLSGFLMTYSGLGREDRYPTTLPGCVKFAWKKIRKLYPLYFITLLLLVLRIVILAPDDPDPAQVRVYARQFFSSIVLLQSWFFDKDMAFSLNAVGWYLSTSVFAYLLFPWVLRWVSKIKSAAAALWGAVGYFLFMLLAAVLFPHVCALVTGRPLLDFDDMQYCFCYFFPPFRSGEFIIGCFLGCAFSRMDRDALDTRKITGMELLGIAGLVSAQIVFCRYILPGYLTCGMIYIPCSALMLFSFALGRGRIAQLLDCKLTRLIAGYSVEIFLLHYTVIKYATPISTFLPIPFVLQQAVFLVLAIGGTFVSVVLYRRLSNRFPALSVH